MPTYFFSLLEYKMNSKDFKNNVLSLSDRIFPMVARMLGNDTDAKDAVQEIMIKLWDRRKQIGNHPSLTGFVFLTARNYCIDLLKKKKARTDFFRFSDNSIRCRYRTRTV